MISMGLTQARQMIGEIRQAAEALVACANEWHDDPDRVAEYIDGVDDKICRYVRACCGEGRQMIDVRGKRGLSIGCGLIRQGDDFVHLDCRHTPATDYVVDLNRYPWPIPSSWAEIVVAHDIIEHLNDRIHAVEEIWRVLRPDGLAHVRMPWHGHPQAFRALDHQCYAALDSLDLFIRGTEYHRGYSYYTHCRFDKLECGYAGAEIVWLLQKVQTDDGRWEF